MYVRLNIKNLKSYNLSNASTLILYKIFIFIFLLWLFYFKM